jgi:3-hydroxymyristoyl/3-hydroxydecanoyl-(acyl carrier protein) dehydratase
MNVVDPEITAAHVGPLRADLDISVPGNLFFFQGHFPGHAILPGVVQVHWAIELARTHLGLKPLFRSIEGLKFHHVIKPETKLRLTLEKSEQTGKLHFSFASEIGVHSQGRILFE